MLTTFPVSDMIPDAFQDDPFPPVPELANLATGKSHKLYTSSSYPDSLLMALVQQGDENALSRLFDLHSKLVYSVALRILRDPCEAEDVLQEVYLQMWRVPGAFTAVRGGLCGWLAVITRNRSIDILRQRRPMYPIEDMPLAMPHNVADDAEHLILIGRARSAIAGLPEVQRSALEMAFFEGCTHAEIARASGVPLGTIKTRIRTGLQALRACWPTSPACEGVPSTDNGL